MLDSYYITFINISIYNFTDEPVKFWNSTEDYTHKKLASSKATTSFWRKLILHIH